MLRTVELPTGLLPRGRTPDGVRLRAADGTDWPAVRAIYDEVARTGNGLLSRRNGPFVDPPGAELPEGVDGVMLALGADDKPIGYASWQRGAGYGDTSVITVPDCLALTAGAALALLAALGSWMTVAPIVRLRLLPWADAVSVHLPLERAREHHVDVWMHRPLDVVGAVGARGWPAAVSGSVAFRLADPLLAANDGGWRLTLDGGDGRLERAADTTVATLDVRGWSLLWTGAARAAQLRHAGLLTGGDRDNDAGLDALLGGGGTAALLDYF